MRSTACELLGLVSQVLLRSGNAGRRVRGGIVAPERRATGGTLGDAGRSVAGSGRMIARRCWSAQSASPVMPGGRCARADRRTWLASSGSPSQPARSITRIAKAASRPSSSHGRTASIAPAPWAAIRSRNSIRRSGAAAAAFFSNVASTGDGSGPRRSDPAVASGRGFAVLTGSESLAGRDGSSMVRGLWPCAPAHATFFDILQYCNTTAHRSLE